jgi:hypothetical protein
MGGRRIEICSIVNQSTARKSDQSEVAISGRLANQNPGKRTNQKAGYKKKQKLLTLREAHEFTRCVTRSLVLCVCFVDRCLSFVLFLLAIVLSILLQYTTKIDDFYDNF